MSLYVPAAFAIGDRAAAARLMHDHPFATLVTATLPEPHVSHLPLLVSAGCEPHGTLLGHFARANPHWQHAGGAESIAIFHGPHAYVSPTWYAEPARMVPTWNYATVHAHGALEILDTSAEKQQILDALLQRFESVRAVPWTFAMPTAQRDAMIGAIVGFRMRIRRIDVKFKLSQNRSDEDRTRVIAALEREGYPEATATAAWMRAYGEAN